MAKASTQKSLDEWTKQEWTTASGKPSTQGPEATGEVYAPKKTIQSLKGTKRLARANAIKRQATKKGEQHAPTGIHKGKKR